MTDVQPEAETPEPETPEPVVYDNPGADTTPQQEEEDAGQSSGT